MLKLYRHHVRERRNNEPEFQPLTNDLIKQLIRMLLLTGDEKIFQPLVIIASNQFFSFLLQDMIYGQIILSYINNPENNVNSAVFVNVFPRLLLYECQEEIRCALIYVYEILWALCCYNDHHNLVQDMIANRNQESKLLNLLDLLMLHITRSDEEGDQDDSDDEAEKADLYDPKGLKNVENKKKSINKKNTLGLLSLQFLVNLCLYNNVFRELLIKSPKNTPICKIIMERVSQRLNRDDDIIVLGKTILAIKLVYMLFMHSGFQIRVLRDVFIDKQERDFFELTFSSADVISSRQSQNVDSQVEISSREKAVNEGRLFSFCTWTHVVLANNIVKQYDDLSILSFVESSVATACLRMFRVIVDKYSDIFIRDLRNVRGFYDQFLSTMLSVLRASVDECLAGSNKPLDEANHRFLMLREHAAIIVHIFSFLMQQREPAEITRQEMVKLHRVLIDQGENVIQKALTTLRQTIEKVDNKEKETNDVLIDNLTQLLKYTQYFRQQKQ